MFGMTTKEAAKKWGVTPRQVQLLCVQGRIPGAVRFGHAWAIPADAQKPQDGRCKQNKTKDEVAPA
jgi:hypothetical protein